MSEQHLAMMAQDLPTTHKTLVLGSIGSGFHLREVPTPRATSGSLVIRVLAADILSYHREIYSGERPYPLHLPIVGGCSAIGRVAEAGPDSTILAPGQLVFFDCTIRGRDDQGAIFLLGIHTGFCPSSQKLSKEVWRDGAFAEFMNVPLENCIALEEERLCKSLGYTIPDLMYLGKLLVPYGGLRDISVSAGDTVVVCPATGAFGGAGVLCAALMGATVVAMGRNEDELARIKTYMSIGVPWSKVRTVKMTGDQDTDTISLRAHGPIDAVLDLTPTFASESTHLRSAIASLRHEGRISLMGTNNLPLTDWQIMSKNITLKGKLMYSRDDMLQFVKMFHAGMLPTSRHLIETKAYPLAAWKEALDAAAEWTGLGKGAIFEP